VRAGVLRLALLSAAGVLTDAVVCGQDGEYVTALGWVNQAEASKLCGGGDQVALSDARLREHLSRALAELNAAAGSAARVEAPAVAEASRLSLDAGEITDKGYINQRACLDRRAAEVARLYAAEPDAEVIVAASVAAG